MKNNGLLGFIALGSMMTAVFLIAVNLVTGFSHFWAIYPSAFLMCPFVLLFYHDKGLKFFSLIISLVFTGLCAFQNFMETPGYPWILYVLAPAVLGPLMVFLGRRSLTRKFASAAASGLISYYLALNIFFESGYPWAIFTTFAFLWWPLSLFLARKPLTFASVGSGLIILFFSVLNEMTTPETIWAIYPVFLVAWWPLSIFYFVYCPGKRAVGTMNMKKS
ncbi:hypothetical protein [Sporolactobacillus putidus]|uniref:Uncharacterized protein n=1 Tax=Sporolactobacillus putidus TaxID=492735 RepID=A0A917RZR1_9BACL|nr:hypothetical protein [Sporolactobacillus putidus]GGL47417.1 hypothetical protein GCM10007968_09370 [Sporolactobacillus putidus]